MDNLFQYIIIMLYSNRVINSISLIITILIFIGINPIINKIPEYHVENFKGVISNISGTIDKIKNNINSEENDVSEIVELGDWYIEIPSINLKAPIGEGTTKDVLNMQVGHFTDTATENGNVGLAAHNRGYQYNYFENLKKLKIDDEIIYVYKQFTQTYLVDKMEIIENTDWSYLESTEENKITLITCVENEPNYRRCIQAISIED